MIADRYVHRLTIRRPVPTGEEDAYGQPLTAPELVAVVPGLVQPRSSRELALASQAGALIGTHVGYLAPLAGLTADAWVELDGRRFDVVGIADAAGLGHHLELSLRSVD